MRVAFDARTLAGPSAQRGIGRFTTSLLTAVATHRPDIEVTLLTWPAARLDPVLDRFRRIDVAPPTAADPAPFLRIARYGIGLATERYGWLWHRRAQRDAFLRALGSEAYDLLHIGSPLEFPLEVASIRARVAPRAPVTATLMDAIPFVLRADFYDRWLPYARDHGRDSLTAVGSYDGAAALSEAVRDDFATLGVRESARTQVVAPSVEPPFGPVGPRARFARRYAIFVSGPDLNKDLPRAARIVATRPDLDLHVVCADTEEKRGQVMAQTGEGGLRPDRVVVTGWLPEEDLAAWVRGAEVALVTSRIEGFGLPALQALACQTPVIVSDIPSLRGIVGDAGVILRGFEPDDHADALTQALEGRREWGSRAEARVARFTPRKLAQGYAELWRDAVDAR